MKRLKEWMRRRLREWLGISDNLKRINDNEKYICDHYHRVYELEKYARDISNKIVTHEAKHQNLT